MKNNRAKNGGNDQYFTKKEIADICVERLLQFCKPSELFIEPSAGDGVFLQNRLNIIGYDLFPKHEKVIKSDWFDVDVPEGCVVIGNPPFGFAASMAVKFFNHAASKASLIAFIVPKSFKKQSIKNKLNLCFWLVDEFDLPKNSFRDPDTGKEYDVPCCFQIWERREQQRQKNNICRSEYISFCKKEDANCAIRRVGGRAGKLLDGMEHSQSSTYFCFVEHEWVFMALRNIDLSIVNYTAGVRSISKSELICLIEKYGVEHGFI